MEKTEDFNVLELQELAIKHNCGKKHTSLAQKSMIVKSYLLNHVPLEQLSKDFGVSVRSIRRWISIFAAPRKDAMAYATSGQENLTGHRAQPEFAKKVTLRLVPQEFLAGQQQLTRQRLITPQTEVV